MGRFRRGLGAAGAGGAGGSGSGIWAEAEAPKQAEILTASSSQEPRESAASSAGRPRGEVGAKGPAKHAHAHWGCGMRRPERQGF
jgi:hypothetical protein